MFYVLRLYDNESREEENLGTFYTVAEAVQALRFRHSSWKELKRYYMGNDILIMGEIDGTIKTAALDAFM